MEASSYGLMDPPLIGQQPEYPQVPTDEKTLLMDQAAFTAMINSMPRSLSPGPRQSLFRPSQTERPEPPPPPIPSRGHQIAESLVPEEGGGNQYRSESPVSMTAQHRLEGSVPPSFSSLPDVPQILVATGMDMQKGGVDNSTVLYGSPGEDRPGNDLRHPVVAAVAPVGQLELQQQIVHLQAVVNHLRERQDAIDIPPSYDSN